MGMDDGERRGRFNFAVLYLEPSCTLVWAFGLLLGIEMLFGGASLIAMALGGARKVTRSGRGD